MFTSYDLGRIAHQNIASFPSASLTNTHALCPFIDTSETRCKYAQIFTRISTQKRRKRRLFQSGMNDVRSRGSRCGGKAEVFPRKQVWRLTTEAHNECELALDLRAWSLQR